MPNLPDTTWVMVCPVCGEEVLGKTWLEDNSSVKEKVSCTTGHWSFDYDHGNFTERVGERVWHWTDDILDAELVVLEDEIDVAILALQHA